jgi:methylated-DNA-[protein]-cysteine S-methyltransferase
MPQQSMHSPIGDLTITSEDGALVALDWGWARDQASGALLDEAKAQLEAYFDGARQTFDLPLAPAGTAFQQRVWQLMAAIPCGGTRSYGAMARDLESAARAVGMACGANPIPVIIPCHRVLAVNGMGGYSGEGGLKTKIALLRLEGALL